jgi:hypothetical protein
MNKFSIINHLVLALVVIVATNCQEESLICKTCGPPPDECTTCPPPPDDDGEPCLGPDFIITSVVKAGEPDEFHHMPYKVFVKNVGNVPATLNFTTNQLGFQGYLSRDGFTREIAACGSTFPNGVLGVNQTTSASISCTLNGVNLSLYPYLIVYLTVSANLGECPVPNNTVVITPLPL